MYWRIHRAIIGSRENEIRDVLTSFGDEFEFIDGKKRNLPVPPPQGYTGAGLAITTLQDAADLPWMAIPGIFYDDEKYKISYYLPRIDKDIPVMNRSGCLMPFGMLDMLPEMMGSKKLFIRPDSQKKIFPGQVIDISNSSALINASKTYHINSETLCWCSASKEIDPIEWRIWINRGEILAWSPYAWEDEPPWAQLPDNVLQIATQMAKNPWSPDLSYVVDIGTNEGQAAVLEINATSTSGLYNVPIATLLSGLRETCILEANQEIFYEEHSNHTWR